jgi:hypothetical protein
MPWMRNLTDDYLIASLLSAVLGWQLIAGRAMSAWWQTPVFRQERPWAYGFLMAVQGAILVPYLMTGKTSHVR